MIGNNPLLNTFMGAEVSEEEQDYREQLRENELRLLGTMLFQSVLLALCILLYVNWSWSHFNTAYESAIFSTALPDSPCRQRFTSSTERCLRTLLSTADN